MTEKKNGFFRKRIIANETKMLLKHFISYQMLLLFAGDNCGLFIFFKFFSSYHKENIENKDFEHLIAIEEFDKILR